MSWTHSICAPCWNDANPDRPAYVVKAAPQETCCFCGAVHESGIYIRKDPKLLLNCPGHED